MENSSAKTMRTTAGVLYLVLSVYQMFLTRAVTLGSGFSKAYFTWIYAVALAVGAGVMAVWMFSSAKPVKAVARRAVTVGSILVIAFELITFPGQAVIINFTLQQSLAGIADQALWQYIFIILRIILVLAGMFVVMNAYDRGVNRGVPAGAVVDENRFKKTPPTPLPSDLDNPLSVPPADKGE